MSSHYGYGKRKELQMGEVLERRGFKWGRAASSQGPIDLIAARGRLRLAIQVKATRSEFTSYIRLSPRDEIRLIRSAAGRKASPTLALVSRNYFWLISVPDEILIEEGTLTTLRYLYPDER